MADQKNRTNLKGAALQDLDRAWDVTEWIKNNSDGQLGPKPGVDPQEHARQFGIYERVVQHFMPEVYGDPLYDTKGQLIHDSHRPALDSKATYSELSALGAVQSEIMAEKNRRGNAGYQPLPDQSAPVLMDPVFSGQGSLPADPSVEETMRQKRLKGMKGELSEEFRVRHDHNETPSARSAGLETIPHHVQNSSFPLDMNATNEALSVVGPDGQKTTFAIANVTLSSGEHRNEGRVYHGGSEGNIGTLTQDSPYNLNDFEEMSEFKAQVRQAAGQKMPWIDQETAKKFTDPNGQSISTFAIEHHGTGDDLVHIGRIYRGGSEGNIGQKVDEYDLTDPAQRAMFEEKAWVASDHDPANPLSPRGTQTMDWGRDKIVSASGITPPESFERVASSQQQPDIKGPVVENNGVGQAYAYRP